MTAFGSRTGLLALWGLFLIGPVVLAADRVDVKTVKYEGLSDTIKKLKGKVVVVDFWADF
jgi:hypothetical protein